jgi:hypothetical protein
MEGSGECRGSCQLVNMALPGREGSHHVGFGGGGGRLVDFCCCHFNLEVFILLFYLLLSIKFFFSFIFCSRQFKNKQNESLP